MAKKRYTVKLQSKDYHQFITKDTSDGQIFEMIRGMQNDAVQQDVEISNNLGKFYWELVDYRDSLRRKKQTG